MINSYNVVLTDKHGSVNYEIGRVNLAAFIAGVNWETVTSLTVEPINPDPEDTHWFSEEVAELMNESAEEEWRTVEKLPTRSFQINQRGDIRHKFNQKVISPSLDLDSAYYMTVHLKINGVDYYVNGPALANEMWGVPV